MAQKQHTAGRAGPLRSSPLRRTPGIEYILSMSLRAACFSFFGFFLPLAEGIDRRC